MVEKGPRPLPKYGPIEEALDYPHAIQIIPKELCLAGINHLTERLLQTFSDPHSFSLTPILRGGGYVGEKMVEMVQEATRVRIAANPMQMSHYGDDGTVYNPPICKQPLDLDRLLLPGMRIKPVVFVEAVVETQESVLAAMDAVNDQIRAYNQMAKTSYPYPEYFTLALISKTEGATRIPHFEYGYHVDPWIWVAGNGCDLFQQGRELDNIVGIKSPYATGNPPTSYCTANFEIPSVFPVES